MAMRFPPAWLDELRERADIVQVVSRHVQLTQRGGRYWGLCPFHGEKTPSFSVSPQKQMYYCFGCHAGGSAITFLMEIEHLEFRDAVLSLAEQTHMQVPQMLETEEERLSRSEKDRLFEANRECARFFHAQLWKDENAHMLAYLHDRGVNDHTIRKFGLGCTPSSSDGATRALTAMGYTEEELVQAGISVKRENRAFDMFRSRVIFPIIDGHGRVLGFGGRALGDAKPKYLNTGDTPIFNKRKGVFAVNLLVKQRNLRRVILTEGYMDVIAMTQAGIPGVCATLGTALTEEQARLLKRWAPEVWVSYDGDSAGQHAILRALDIFEQEDFPARVLDFPEGMDPDEFIRTKGKEAASALTPVDSVIYRMRREAENHEMATQEGRTAYAKACAKWLSRVKEPVELENYVQRLMIETGFSREVLLAQIGRTEMLGTEERKTYQRRAKPLDFTAGGEDKGALAAERQLLRLLSDGLAGEGIISADDFITAEGRELASKLLSGQQPGAILEAIEDDEKRGRAAEIFQGNSPGDEETDLQIVHDCLEKLHIRRIEIEIDELSKGLASVPAEEKRAALQRIQELTEQRRLMGTRKEG